MTSSTRSVGGRRWLWPGAVCLLLLASGVWIAVGSEAPPPSEARPAAPREEERPPRPTVAPPVTRSNPPRTLPTEGVPPPTPPVAQPERLAPPVPAPLVPAPRDSLASDPFEPQEGQEPAIRTLAAVGDIQLGVVRNSKVRDEPGLKSALVRIGDDLEKRSREQQWVGATGRQEVLDGYREELGRYMDGEVELRGPGWMIGAQVGPPHVRPQGSFPVRH